MTDVLRHGFVSPRGDGADPTQIQPSHWNTGHQFQGGAAGNMLIRDPADANFGAKWGVPGVANIYISSATGTVNDWNPGLVTGGGSHFIQWVGTADLAITGLADGSPGKVAYLKNAGSANMLLVTGSASSLASNRFYNMATSAPMPLAPQGYAEFVHNGAVWVMVAHDQGTPITPPYNPLDYFGNGSMSWTVEASDIVAMRYHLRGKFLHVTCALVLTSVGGVANTTLQRYIPAGFSAGAQTDTAYCFLDGGAGGVGTGLLRSTANLLQFFKSLAAPVWTLSSHATYVSGTITFEVN